MAPPTIQHRSGTIRLHLFGSKKNAICRQKLRDDDRVIMKVKTWLQQIPENFHYH
jgi:hypothetical protein